MRPHPIFTRSRLIIRRLNQNYSASDWSEELNLGMKMFTIIILSGVEHGSKVLRRQVVEILGPTQFLRFPSRDSTLKIKITRLLIGVRK